MYQLQFYPMPSSPFQGIELRDCGWQRCIGPYETKPGIRAYFSLHFVFSGKGHFCTQNQEWTLSAGEGFLIRPFEIISYQADPDDPWEYAFVSFRGSDSEALLKAAGLDGKNVFRASDKEGAQQALERMLELARADRSPLALYSAMMDFAACIPAPVTDNVPRIGGEYYHAAQAYIQRSYAFPISVEEIAQHIGVDRTYLFRLFKRFANLSPQAYLRKYRVHKAKRLLLESNLTLDQIASSTGLNSAAHLSKAFRDIYGYAPGVLRHNSPEEDETEPQNEQT